MKPQIYKYSTMKRRNASIIMSAMPEMYQSMDEHNVTMTQKA